MTEFIRAALQSGPLTRDHLIAAVAPKVHPGFAARRAAKLALLQRKYKGSQNAGPYRPVADPVSVGARQITAEAIWSCEHRGVIRKRQDGLYELGDK